MSNMYASPPDSPDQQLARGSEEEGGSWSRSGDMSPMFTRQTMQNSGRGSTKRGGGGEGVINKEMMRRNMAMQSSFDLQAIHRIDLKSSFDQQYSTVGYQRWNHSRNGDKDSSFSGSHDGRTTEPSTPILLRRKPESSTGGSVMPPAKTPPNPGNPPSSKKQAGAPMSPSESLASRASISSSFGSGHRLMGGSARKQSRASDSEGYYDREDGDVSPLDAVAAAAKSTDRDRGDEWRPCESSIDSTLISPIMAVKKQAKEKEPGPKPCSEKILQSRSSVGGSSPSKQGQPLTVEIEKPMDGRADDSRGHGQGRWAGVSAESSSGEFVDAVDGDDDDDDDYRHHQGTGSDREERSTANSLIQKSQDYRRENSLSDKTDGTSSDAGFANQVSQAAQVPSSKAEVSPSGRAAEGGARGVGRHFGEAQQGAWHGPVSRGGASTSPQNGGGGSATSAQSPSASSIGIEGISLVAGPSPRTKIWGLGLGFVGIEGISLVAGPSPQPHPSLSRRHKRMDRPLNCVPHQ